MKLYIIYRGGKEEQIRIDRSLNIIIIIIHADYPRACNRITVVTRIQYAVEDLHISLPVSKHTPRACSLNTRPSTVYIT